MDNANFPIEFNNEVDDVKQSDHELYSVAVDRLTKLAAGHKKISGAVVNLKLPAQHRKTILLFEVTIVDYRESEHIAATEKKEQFRGVLNGALDGVERQVRALRNQQRNSVNHRFDYPHPV